MFWVTLINVTAIPNDDAFQYLKDNCTHIDKNTWIMEGDVAFLFDEDIGFEVLTEGTVPSLGGLSRQELISICDIHLGVKV